MSSLTRPFTRRSALTSSHFLTSPLTLSTSRPFHKVNFLSALSESDHGRREFRSPRPLSFISSLSPSRRRYIRTLCPSPSPIFPPLKGKIADAQHPLPQTIRWQITRLKLTNTRKICCKIRRMGKGSGRGSCQVIVKLRFVFSFFFFSPPFWGSYSCFQQMGILGVDTVD